MDHTIICFDEAAFRLVPVYRKRWFFKGEKPRAIFWWCNKKLNVFGALIDGQELFYDFFDAQNSITFKAFLSRLFETLDENKKYVFILDNASWHKTDVIKKYLAKNENVKVEYLPPYSPELNPIETIWKITRANETNSRFYENLDVLQEALENYWTKNNFMLNVSNYLCR